MQSNQNDSRTARRKLAQLLERSIWIVGILICVGMLCRMSQAPAFLMLGAGALGFAALFLSFSLVGFLRLRRLEDLEQSATEKEQSQAIEQILLSLAQMKEAFERQLEVLRTVQAKPPAVITKSGRPQDLSNLSTAEILEQINAAKKMGEADEVLDLRESLIPRLNDAKRLQFDTELAGWVLQYFQRTLRAGKATMVAPSLGRAVQALEHIEEMKHLAASLPTIRRSAGLCVECGKPFRGEEGICPTCRAAKFADLETEDEIDLRESTSDAEGTV